MINIGMIIVSCIIEIFLYHILCYYLFGRSQFKYKVELSIILTFLKIIFNMLGIPSINIASSIIIYLIIIIIMYEGKLSFKFIIVFVYFSLTMFSESFVFVITVSTFIEKYMVIRVLLSKVITLLMILFIKGIKQLRNDFFTKKEMFILLFQPISLIIFMFITNGIVITDVNIKTMMVFGTLLLLISSVVSFYVIEEVISKHKIENELKLRTEREKDSQEYYKELSNSIKSYKALKHDWIKHLSVIKSLVFKKKNTEVLEYIDILNKRILELNDIRSGNEMLDILLISRIKKINELHINMIYEINEVDLTWINLFDLTMILGNILDNAIESNMLCDDRYIKIQIYQYNEFYLIIKISNACNKVMVNKYGDFTSTKIKHQGIGIKNIKLALSNYNSHINFDYIEEKKTFITKIVLKVNKD